MNIKNVKRRFLKHLSPRPRYGLGKELYYWGDLETAIKNSNNIELNRLKKSYISLDLDYEGSADAWNEFDVPEPTIVIINPKNYHCHMHWELTYPITVPSLLAQKCNIPYSFASFNYFKAVKNGMTYKLNGDNGYVGCATKNPFSNKWITYWTDNTYTLDYLSEFASPINKNTYKQDINDINFGGRNDEMFHIARYYAYKIIFDYYNDYEIFYSELYKYCNEYNINIIYNKYESGSLWDGEVKSICKGVANWVWMRKDLPYMKRFKWNVGVLNYEKISKNIPDEEKRKIINNRQSHGAIYASKTRSDKTKNKIINAIKYFNENNIKITKKSIAQYVGISPQSIYKRYNSLF